MKFLFCVIFTALATSGFWSVPYLTEGAAKIITALCTMVSITLVAVVLSEIIKD